MVPHHVSPHRPSKSFLHRKIYSELLSAITHGKYLEGQRLPSEAQLVRQFKASRPTVTRALQELQHEGVVERRAGSGTFVRQAKSQGYLFGLLVHKLGETEIFDPICRELVKSAQSSGHSVLWSATDAAESTEREIEAICAQYVDRKVSGIFLAPVEVDAHATQINQHLLASLERAKIAVVLLDRDFYEYPARSPYDLVGIDNRRAGYLAADHLLGLGCRRIAFLHRPNSAETVRSRISGFSDALLMHDVPANPQLICEGEPTDESLVRQLVRDNQVDSVICANDLTAAMLMNTLDNLGVRIPEEIRIVGIDDVRYASLLRVPLTTVHQPCRAIGRNAVLAMVERLANPQMPSRDIRLQGHLVIRKSSGADLKKSPPAKTK